MMPANLMSPDEMLRAYAARKVTSPTSSPSPTKVAYPAPVANYKGNGMRTLYSPTKPGSIPASAVPREMRNAYANDEDNYEDAYGGTAH
jgi:hypothetical protein